MGRWNKLLLSLWGLFIILVSTQAIDAEVLYKRYYVHNVNGRDILSEPYTVRPNDYVIKILKQKGEISHTNFPLFLNIFKLINHHIANINRIHPGERIFVPLKWLEADALPGQRRGMVDLPFITAAPVKQMLTANATSHKVQSGESVSRIISQQFGPAGSRSYQEGLKLFRLVNPTVKNVNRIYIGQKLKIPDASILEESWYTSVFEADGEVVLDTAKPDPAPAPAEVNGITQYENETGTKDPFDALSKLLGGVLLNRGRYYFPDTDGKDFSVNLSETPILQLPEGRRILFIQNGLSLSGSRRHIMAAHFKNLRFTETSREPSLALLLDSILLTYPKISLPMPLSFSEEGMNLSLQAHWAFKYDRSQSESSFRGLIVSELTDPSQRFPLPLVAYLRKHGLVLREALQEEALPPAYFAVTKSTSLQEIIPYTQQIYVEELAKALGLLYDPNISISFSYAGMQLETTSNMIRTNHGHETLVNFGDLYGDAVFAIERSGLKVVTIRKEDYLLKATLQLLTTLGIPFEENPHITIGEPGDALACELSVEGVLVNPAPLVKKLIVATQLPDEIIAVLEEQGFGIIQIR
ncbi:LysM domain-containing protein [Desulfoluna sp.]|uniref:LysM peptidoglycan-binding domain-containing protein n=1 Tax=Desulfoluna sp. TaxID=2045199 RepID=UPI0026150231|nr:LysM domain-containing protein [Desulfoluna sp.]